MRGRVPEPTRAAEPVAVVGDQHRSPAVVFVPARPTPAHVEFAAARAEHVRHGVEQGADLGVAVAGALDRLGVKAERDVVDEHPAVDLARSTRRSPPSTNASRAPTTSSRSTPRSSAKWLRVPAGTHAYGSPNSAATAATIACEPSPPAIASPSAPRSTASRTSTSRSSPAFSSIGSMPRFARLLSERETLRLPPAGARIEEQHRIGAEPGHSADPRGRREWHAPPPKRPAAPPRPAHRPTATHPQQPGQPRRPARGQRRVNPATRATPRRSTPYQADAPAISTQPNTPRPRGNSATATTTASTTVAAPTTNAKIANNRRLIRSGRAPVGAAPPPARSSRILLIHLPRLTQAPY